MPWHGLLSRHQAGYPRDLILVQRFQLVSQLWGPIQQKIFFARQKSFVFWLSLILKLKLFLFNWLPGATVLSKRLSLMKSTMQTLTMGRWGSRKEDIASRALDQSVVNG